jgi:nuclease HARBI1
MVELKSKGTCTNIYAFINGTVRRICRPKYHQKAAYSGHKRYHGLKYQSDMVPERIIMHRYGPVAGSRHDAFC